MTRSVRLLGSMGVLAVWLSCGGNAASPASRVNADAGSSAAACPELGGTWVIQAHCSAALQGMKVMIEQSACAFTTSGSFPGFTGTVSRDGKVTLSGTANGMSVACSGDVSAQQIMEICTGDCHVTLSR